MFQILNAGHEIRAAWIRSVGLLASILFFSVFSNVLLLTGPLFMLQVYDRVLGSGAQETLLALSVLVTFLFLVMGVLDLVRGRVAARVGARLQATLDERVFRASLLRAGETGRAETGLSDLAATQQLLSSPVFMALCDLLWTPFFIVTVFLLHPVLGFLAVGGGLVLIAIALINQASSRVPLHDAQTSGTASDRYAAQLQVQSELVRSLGMQGHAIARWKRLRGLALEHSLTASDRVGGYTTLTRTFRLFLQSAMLAVGAYLALRQEVTAGAMVTGSILMGRALAPIEAVISQWRLVARAIEGQRALTRLLHDVPSRPAPMPLPRPKAVLEVSNLAVTPPGETVPTLRGVSFRILPGQAVGVIGASGAGKTTLAKALTGVWRPSEGAIRLDGATFDQFDADVFGQLIGYLPQQVTLFDGTLAENIARLDPNPDHEAVVRAATLAAADTMIRKQPKGYNTPMTHAAGRLSGGQIQRVGLARALYGNPVLLVLDEPNSNLDNEGSQALNQAIRGAKAAGMGVLIMAHRPAAIRECDLLLVLVDGKVSIFGPRDEVLAKTVQNSAQIIGLSSPTAYVGGAAQ